MAKPLILVTNDDGITAKGIQSLVKAVMPLGKVVVVAPDSPQSGMGHAITVNKPLRLSEFPFMENVEAYTTTGTPVDCVKLAIFEVLDRKPDVLVSGINHGANCSTNVLYSGTMSAAVEGAMEGIPSIGFSLLDFAPDADFDLSMQVAEKVTASVLEHGMGKGYCLNVNIPKIRPEFLKGIKVCRQAAAFWEDSFDRRIDPFGKPYFWLQGDFGKQDTGDDTDLKALDNNYVSIVPTQFDMTAHHAMSELNSWGL